MIKNSPEYNQRISEEALEYAEKEWGLKRERFISRGAFGVVYLATDDEQLKHPVIALEHK